MSINRFKVVLTEKGKKNKWLVQELGKSEYAISNWYTYGSQLSLETLRHIANVINLEVKELINSTKFDE